MPDEYIDRRTDYEGSLRDRLYLAAAGMNDQHHPFKQIADVAGYFGPKEVAW